LWRRLIQKRKNALVGRHAVGRLLAPARTVLEPGKPVIGKPMPPLADDTRLNAHFLSDRPRAAALRRKQHDPRPLHVALRRARCSASRLKHLAYLRRSRQHALVGFASNALPTSVLGDPMQAIFGFGQDDLAKWDDSV
jgi:hypothetical protein